MSAAKRFFIDTNVLVYADDLDGGQKSQVAQALLERALTDGTGVVSTQILQEFFVVSTRKLGAAPRDARRKVELLGTMDVVQIRSADVLAAIDTSIAHQLSFWDSLVLRCAAVAGCSRLVTEDLQHGFVLDSVRVENPF